MTLRAVHIVAAFASAVALAAGAALAQAPPNEHEQHHPAGVAPPPPPAPRPAAPTRPPSPPDMSSMMRAMERMMPGVPEPLLSRALGAARLSPSERDRLRTDSEQRITRGQALVERGARELQAAVAAADRPRADRAITDVYEGTRDVEAARGVLDALTLPPAETEARALAWFKREMSIAESPGPTAGWFRHWLFVGVLAAVSLAGMAHHMYRVARSVRSLTRISPPSPPR